MLLNRFSFSLFLSSISDSFPISIKRIVKYERKENFYFFKNKRQNSAVHVNYFDDILKLCIIFPCVDFERRNVQKADNL